MNHWRGVAFWVIVLFLSVGARTGYSADVADGTSCASKPVECKRCTDQESQKTEECMKCGQCRKAGLQARDKRTLGGGLLKCKAAWTHTKDRKGQTDEERLGEAGVGEYREAPEVKFKVKVVVHLMEAELGPLFDRKKADYEALRYLVAPEDWAVSRYWTPGILREFLGCNGSVNRIWEQAGIQVSLVGVESCEYGEEPDWSNPSKLGTGAYRFRLDEIRRSRRDSIFIPETTIPWATELFASINRIFTVPEPDILHILIWWSVGEGSRGYYTNLSGYSRAAGRGGPAVWISTYHCLYFESPEPSANETCARLLAHEIGHALMLHHVQPGPDPNGPDQGTPEGTPGDVRYPASNLMRIRYPGDSGDCLEKWQKVQSQEEAGRRFTSCQRRK